MVRYASDDRLLHHLPLQVQGRSGGTLRTRGLDRYWRCLRSDVDAIEAI